jgi:hypothetical protein
MQDHETGTRYSDTFFSDTTPLSLAKPALDAKKAFRWLGSISVLAVVGMVGKHVLSSGAPGGGDRGRKPKRS